VTQSDLGLVPARLEVTATTDSAPLVASDIHVYLNLVRPFYQDEAAVMWPCSSFVFHCQIEKPVHDRV